MSREAAEVARKAAEIIEARGKATGTVQDREGRVCLWGALGIAHMGDADAMIASPLYWTFRHVLEARYEPGDCYAFPGADFNDDPATTERDVAKLLLQVADELEVAP